MRAKYFEVFIKFDIINREWKMLAFFAWIFEGYLIILNRALKIWVEKCAEFKL